jgi:hypothetical protein
MCSETADQYWVMGEKAMPYLSKIDIEAIANRIIDQYKLRYIPSKRLCYRVDPIELAEMLGLSVYFRQLSYDHSILGMTAPDEVMVPIFDENKERSIFILDGKTVLIEACLNHSPKAKGRRNFTIAHECAHQILYRLYPEIYGPNQRVLCDYRRNNAPRRKIEDWEEWQADALAACLLLPEDAVKDAMFVYGLGDKVKVLSRKYSEYKYQCFCEMADALGVSRSALSFRMEQLGLLERNELIAEARARRGVG